MNNSTNNNINGHSWSPLLELAADNDVVGFKQAVDNGFSIGDFGLWYGFQRVSRKMLLERRTPLMVAAKYGSIDVVRLILSLSEVDVKLSGGPDQCTALHCAASSGSINAVNVVNLLLIAGADRDSTDVHWRRPCDVIVSPPDFPDLRNSLEGLLRNNGCACRATAPTLSAICHKREDKKVSSVLEKKVYPVDPSLPDIKTSVYGTDSFRMFLFKIQPCSRAYSHDWTVCPFLHPNENARRRDLKKFHYSCMPCPAFRKGVCKRGDLCEYAHGIFESLLHPHQYRTRVCKDGMSCLRRVCFFAHTLEELRLPYMPNDQYPLISPQVRRSTRSSMSPSPFNSPMLPSKDGIISSGSIIHPLGRDLRKSCLRTSLNARDIPTEELNMFPDLELHQQQLSNHLSCVSNPLRSNPPSKSLFPAEVSSSLYADKLGNASVLCQKMALLNRLQQQERKLSPIKTKVPSPKNVENLRRQPPFSVFSPS
ncbi:hypothetical protein HS088_TW04G00708 [Tripterygium wilfordii]|uniref:C3H1-type domain-containing protein n=1 Tax=Tripterygium wilfordii TaxID=458696 RepID=A0A7J7DQV7_TRIWF|nr:zinc finger CCCH domain-containing protein 56-like [Tripterygium wilfordii]XP_038699091.1 zinc finger CCCH domain-containing protein 56-like [Tripterygium wilfordii]KAF5748750.1 hypothetical protein HS088_TW04G00708 [Tripterygium wilfordii]